MLRKIALAAAAAVVTLGAGLAATPADARPHHGYHGGGGHYRHHGGGFYAPLGFGIGFGSGYGYGGGYGYGPSYRSYGPPRRYCEETVVRRKIHGRWRRVVEERCYRGRHY